MRCSRISRKLTFILPLARFAGPSSTGLPEIARFARSKDRSWFVGHLDLGQRSTDLHAINTRTARATCLGPNVNHSRRR